MTDKQIMEAMAILDGIQSEVVNETSDRISAGGRIRLRDGKRVNRLPEYLSSLDAVQRVINELSYDELDEAEGYLYIASGSDYAEMLKLTPRQKCEAILKAVGKWEEAR